MTDAYQRCLNCGHTSGVHGAGFCSLIVGTNGTQLTDGIQCDCDAWLGQTEAQEVQEAELRVLGADEVPLQVEAMRLAVQRVSGGDSNWSAFDMADQILAWLKRNAAKDESVEG